MLTWRRIKRITNEEVQVKVNEDKQILNSVGTIR